MKFTLNLIIFLCLLACFNIYSVKKYQNIQENNTKDSEEKFMRIIKTVSKESLSRSSDEDLRSSITDSSLSNSQDSDEEIQECRKILSNSYMNLYNINNKDKFNKQTKILAGIFGASVVVALTIYLTYKIHHKLKQTKPPVVLNY